MTMDDDSGDTGAKGGRRRAPGRRKPPVTIDLAAEQAEAGAPSAEAAEPAAEPQAAESVPSQPAEAPPHPAKAPADAAAEKPAETEPAASPFPARREAPKAEGPGAGRLIAAGIFGGAVATVLGILYHASGIVPTRAEVVAGEATSKVAEVADAVAGLGERISTIEKATAGLGALSEKVAALEKLEETDRSRIENLEHAPLPPAGGGDGSAAAFEPRVAQVESTLASLQSDVKALSGRVDEIATRPPAAVESERAARAVAIGVLRQAAEAGGSFAADLAMLRALGMDTEEVTALAPLAERGAPSLAALQAEFPAVADAILAATSRVDPDAGFFDRVAAFGRGLVSIRPTTPIEGDTPEAVVSRMQGAVNRGDLSAALAERTRLPASGQDASAGWAGAAADRAAIDGLIEKLALSVTPPAN